MQLYCVDINILTLCPRVEAGPGPGPGSVHRDGMLFTLAVSLRAAVARMSRPTRPNATDSPCDKPLLRWELSYTIKFIQGSDDGDPQASASPAKLRVAHLQPLQVSLRTWSVQNPLFSSYM